MGLLSAVYSALVMARTRSFVPEGNNFLGVLSVTLDRLGLRGNWVTGKEKQTHETSRKKNHPNIPPLLARTLF